VKRSRSIFNPVLIASRRIEVRDCETGREYEEAYDALILSTR
jgi:hypothetical protein